MPITSMDGLAAAMAGGTPFSLYKASMTTVAAFMYSLWKAGGNPPVGVTPTTAAYCDDTTVGAIPLPDPGANLLYLLRLAINSSSAHTWILYDRLAHCGNVAPTVLTAQTVNIDVATPASQGRCAADGSNVEWFFEVYTVMGAGTSTATISYTNHLDVAGRTMTIALPATLPVARLTRLIPNTNPTDKIKSIQTVTLSATMTSGVMGITARKRITELPQTLGNLGVVADAIALGVPVIDPLSCLEVCALCSGTSSGLLLGSLKVGAG